MKCFMLEELVVGMPHEESVGLSCHVLPAVDKLFELFVSKVGLWTEIFWSFILVQINCQNHQLGGEREVLLWIWNDGLLAHGYLDIWICHVISIGVQFQSNFISMIIIALLAEVSPHSVILSDQLVEVLSVELIHGLCNPFKIRSRSYRSQFSDHCSLSLSNLSSQPGGSPCPRIQSV